MENKPTIWQCYNPTCNAQYSEYVNGCPKCSTGEPGSSHKVSILNAFHPAYMSMMEHDQQNKYPIGGYAPGNYTCICCICKKEFQGDKRAVQCEECAVNAVQDESKLTPDQFIERGGFWQSRAL